MGPTLPALLELLGMASVLMFVGSLLAIPVIVGRLPRDFFIRHREQVLRRRRRHPLLAGVVLVVRNAVGLVLLAAGVVMLVLPGQGLLTMLIGLSAMTFPGKLYLIDQLLAMGSVRRALNWIRRRSGKDPFVFAP